VTPDTTTDEACAAALATLPGIGPAALVALLDRRAPSEVWDRVRRGELTRPRANRDGADQPTLRGLGPSAGGAPKRHSWSHVASRITVEAWWSAIAARGVRVTWPGQPTYPLALAGDPQPPGVLFWRGGIECLDRPCVAVVGTRNATPDGRAIAFELGRDLARAGVCVVSGLALGIDGAAHAGALESVQHGATCEASAGSVGTVGVAASGVDVPYPRRHAGLWERVVAGGAVISETPPGQPAQAWRFPSRNRIIAGLSRMVVVVESHARGGSLITAEAAIERGIEVRVVPGPVHSPASEGSNQLLYDGPGPVRDAQDVLDSLGILLPGRPPKSGRGRRRPSLPLAAGAVLEAVGWRPATLGQIVARSSRQAAEVMLLLDDLAARGLVREEGGWWSRVK
jgi:DNA processing protein